MAIFTMNCNNFEDPHDVSSSSIIRLHFVFSAKYLLNIKINIVIVNMLSRLC